MTDEKTLPTTNIGKLPKEKTEEEKHQGIFDTTRIKSDRFFNKCKKCNEPYEETIAYRTGMIKQTKHLKVEVEKVYDKMLNEDWTPEQLLVLTHFLKRLGIK